MIQHPDVPGHEPPCSFRIVGDTPLRLEATRRSVAPAAVIYSGIAPPGWVPSLSNWPRNLICSTFAKPVQVCYNGIFNGTGGVSHAKHKMQPCHDYICCASADPTRTFCCSGTNVVSYTRLLNPPHPAFLPCCTTVALTRLQVCPPEYAPPPVPADRLPPYTKDPRRDHHHVVDGPVSVFSPAAGAFCICRLFVGLQHPSADYRQRQFRRCGGCWKCARDPAMGVLLLTVWAESS